MYPVTAQHAKLNFQSTLHIIAGEFPVRNRRLYTVAATMTSLDSFTTYPGLDTDLLQETQV